MANTERRSRTKRGIFIALVLVLLIYIIGSTYARYTSTTDLTGKVQIAKWSVKLNDALMDTTATKDVTLTLSDNDYVSDDRIAPDRSAYFDIILDPTGSEVAIDYTVSCDFANIEGLVENSDSKITITKAEYWRAGAVGTAGTGTTIDVANLQTEDGIKISETLAEVEANTKIAARITVTWDNDSDNHNVKDTANGVAAGLIEIPVTVTAKQHITSDPAQVIPQTQP